MGDVEETEDGDVGDVVSWCDGLGKRDELQGNDARREPWRRGVGQ